MRHAPCAILWPVACGLWHCGPPWLQVIDLSHKKGLQKRIDGDIRFDIGITTRSTAQPYRTLATATPPPQCSVAHSVSRQGLTDMTDRTTLAAGKKKRREGVRTRGCCFLPHTISSAGSPCTTCRLAAPSRLLDARGQLAPSLFRGVQVGDRPAVHCPITNLN